MKPSTQSRLQKLTADFHAHLTEEAAQVRSLVECLAANPPDRAVAQRLHERVHRLAGSAGLFGLPDLGKTAAAAEEKFELVINTESGPTEADVAAAIEIAESLIDQLVTAGEKAKGDMPSQASAV